MNMFKKLFGLPKPKSLPIRMFCDVNDYTWEDWKQENQAKYPIRYFLSETIPHLWTVYIVMNVRNWYWSLIDFFKKPHMLDLRQPKENKEDVYTGGYIEHDHQLRFACFNILNKYMIEKNKRDEYVKTLFDNEIEASIAPEDTGLCPQPSVGMDEFQKEEAEFLAEQKRVDDIILGIHNYWNKDRKEKLKRSSALLSEWSLSREMYGSKHEPTDALFKQLMLLEEEITKEETDMLIELIKVRGRLWV